jgi:hypothetical protein
MGVSKYKKYLPRQLLTLFFFVLRYPHIIFLPCADTIMKLPPGVQTEGDDYEGQGETDDIHDENAVPARGRIDIVCPKLYRSSHARARRSHREYRLFLLGPHSRLPPSVDR